MCLKNRAMSHTTEVKSFAKGINYNKRSPLLHSVCWSNSFPPSVGPILALFFRPCHLFCCQFNTPCSPPHEARMFPTNISVARPCLWWTRMEERNPSCFRIDKSLIARAQFRSVFTCISYSGSASRTLFNLDLQFPDIRSNYLAAVLDFIGQHSKAWDPQAKISSFRCPMTNKLSCS